MFDSRVRTVVVIPMLAVFAASCASISPQQEVQMGADYARQISQQLPIIADAEVNRYINALGDSLARVADKAGLQWRFHVVDQSEINAFAVPGGYIYVNRGLVARAQNLSQFASVLGHEIAHVTERHSVQQMEKAQNANVGVSIACVFTRVCDSGLAGAGIQIAGGAVFANFSRKDESEADERGLQTMMRARIDPRGMPEMFEILLAERKSSPGALDSWFRSHPLEEDRIQASRAAIARIDPLLLRGLTKNSQTFIAFKRRLASLPPSPAPRRASR